MIYQLLDTSFIILSSLWLQLLIYTLQYYLQLRSAYTLVLLIFYLLGLAHGNSTSMTGEWIARPQCYNYIICSIVLHQQQNE